MEREGLTYKLIASDAEFNKFTIKSNILLVATLIFLWKIREETKIVYFSNFEISKVTFSETMGLLALMMAIFYHGQFNRCIISACLDYVTIGSFKRIEFELGTIYGFLTLAFFLMNQFGFFLGIMWLLVSPPSLLLCHQFARRNVRESQD